MHLMSCRTGNDVNCFKVLNDFTTYNVILQ